MSIFGFFPVRIFPHSNWMPEDVDQKTLNTDTIYTVYMYKSQTEHVIVLLLLSLDTDWASRNNHLTRFTSTNTTMTLSILYLYLYFCILYVAFWFNWSNPWNDWRNKGVTRLVKTVLPVSKQIIYVGRDVCCCKVTASIICIIIYVLRPL